jgi:hypothetical protein
MTNTRGVINGDRRDIKREIGVIPGWAYVAAVVVFVGILFGFMAFLRPASEGQMPLFWIFFPFVPASFVAFLVLMIGYVNRDAGRRGMSRPLWTLIVIFVPNAIGFILYFVLRNPLQTNCPKCGATTDARVNFCPNCRYRFHPACPQCKSAVRHGDTFCANCGTQIEEAAQTV